MKATCYSFLPLIFMAVLTSCNNTPDNDTGTHVHEHSETTAPDRSLEVPEGARVFFRNIAEGAVLSSPFTVEMGVEGMGIEPAGALKDGTGHHHLIINKGFSPKGEVVPADEQHIHFGKGQTETELDLAPGTYTLTLQFANGLHQSYGRDMSASVEVTVQ